jgi:hypothetical protein
LGFIHCYNQRPDNGINTTHNIIWIRKFKNKQIV